ncbi:MAG: helix-turn-helix domain-containing protein [Nitrososphaerota archaeon]|jgi:excisionase family DNA binding protein|nr:helix-turn-helix domain-containing protein [Nitrososphaerota archaeon]
MKTVLGVNLYNVKEVAEMFGVSKTTIHNYIKYGKIDAQKIGGSLYLTEGNIKGFIEGKREVKSNDV